MFQPPAPLPWREAELEYLDKALDIAGERARSDAAPTEEIADEDERHRRRGGHDPVRQAPRTAASSRSAPRRSAPRWTTPASTPTDLEAAYVGNAAAGLVTGQESIRGQVILRAMGLGRLPVDQRGERLRQRRRPRSTRRRPWSPPASTTCVLALGVEKLYHEDKREVLRCLQRRGRRRVRRGVHGAPLQASARPSGGGGRSSRRRREALDVHGHLRRGRPGPHGRATAPPPSSSPMVSAKNSRHGSLNPRAQFREELTRRGGAGRADDRRAAHPADVLADRRRRRGR